MIPQVVDWNTLKEEEKEVQGADDHDHTESRINRPYLVAFARETKEIHANGEFRNRSATDIEKLANKNVLSFISINLALDTLPFIP